MPLGSVDHTICGMALAMVRNRASLARSALSLRSRSLVERVRSATSRIRARSSSLQQRGWSLATKIIATSVPRSITGTSTKAPA